MRGNLGPFRVATCFQPRDESLKQRQHGNWQVNANVSRVICVWEFSCAQISMADYDKEPDLSLVEAGSFEPANRGSWSKAAGSPSLAHGGSDVIDVNTIEDSSG